MTLETKHLPEWEIKDADRGEVRAIIARLNVVDRDGDVTLPGAIPDGTKVKFSAYGHSAVKDGARPVGRGVVSTVGETVVVDGKFFMSTIEGRETFLTLREMGPDQEWSYGYEVDEMGTLTPELKASGARRVLAKVHAIEVSPVLVGAGIGTGTVGIKEEKAPDPPTPTPEELEAKAASDRLIGETRATEQRMLEESLARFQRTRARLGW